MGVNLERMVVDHVDKAASVSARPSAAAWLEELRKLDTVAGVTVEGVDGEGRLVRLGACGGNGSLYFVIYEAEGRGGVRSMHAIRPELAEERGDVPLAFFGEATTMHPANVVPMDSVIKAATYFTITGQPDGEISWKVDVDG